MTKTEAYYAGVSAGREDAKGPHLLNAIEPPDDYTPDQRQDFTLGYLVGQRSQWHDNQIDEIIRARGEYQ